VVVANGGMAGGGTIVSRASLFLSDIFPDVSDVLPGLCCWNTDIFVSDTISAAAGPSCPSPFLSDAISGCTAVLSASSEGRPSFLSDTMSDHVPWVSDLRADPHWACGRTRVCQTHLLGCTTRHIAALRVALHTPLLAPVLQVMADERTGGTDLSGDVTRPGRRLGRPDLLQHRPPPPL